ncbi:MAG: type II toxin-antitoxin system VapC family toxin [Thermoplasmataceae archaeon]
MRGDPLPDYLMDSSSLFKAFFIHSEMKIGVLRNSSISELTIFEVGNVLWKKRDENLMSIPESDLYQVAQRIESVIAFLVRSPISSNELTSIFRLSLETGLTFYDASYLHLARRDGKILITEDKKLSKASTDLRIRTLSIGQIL